METENVYKFYTIAADKMALLSVRAKCRFWKGSETLPDLAMYSQNRKDVLP